MIMWYLMFAVALGFTVAAANSLRDDPFAMLMVLLAAVSMFVAGIAFARLLG